MEDQKKRPADAAEGEGETREEALDSYRKRGAKMQPIMERMNALGIGVEEMARRLDRGAAFIERIAQGEIRFPPMEVVEGIAAELRWNVGEMIVEAGLYTKPLATLYWCNPEINTECGKRSCAYLHADGWCKRTKNPAFAVSGKDGSPLIAPNEAKRKHQSPQYP